MRVPGPTLRQVDHWAATYEQDFTRVIDRVLEQVTADLDDVIGFDDLSAIRRLWADEVDATLLPRLQDRWYHGVNVVRDGLDEDPAVIPSLAAAAGFDVPPPAPELAELWLLNRRNTLVAVGDDVWAAAREQLVIGLQEGDDPQQLTRRVRRTTGFVEPRAHAVARTESNGALNAGSITQVRLTGQRVTKEWVSTHDRRTRPSHLEADGQVVGLDEPFLVGGHSMDRPHDLGAPADEVVNCRCTVVFNFQPPEEVQRALVAAAQDRTGAMVALVPSDADLDRFAIGAEPRGQLHLTLAYLGDGADWSTEQRDALVGRMEALVPRGAVEGNVFGAAYWNPDGPDPAWVLNVGGEELEVAHGAVWDVLRSLELRQAPALPEQHAPWVPHICVAYDDGPTDETYDVYTFRDMVGPVTFDTLRISFAGETTDLALGEEDLAASGCVPCGTIVPDPNVGGVVPYDVKQGGGTCGSTKWAVVKKDGGRTMGCHDSKADAEKQRAAIHVHEGAGVQDVETLISLSLRDMHLVPVLLRHGELTVPAEEVRMSTTYPDPSEGPREDELEPEVPDDTQPNGEPVPPETEDPEELEAGGKPSSGTPADKRKKENKKQTRGYDTIKQQALAVEATPDGAWYAPALTVEGRPTGDRREFGVESLEWPEMPLTLTYQPPSHGGVSTDGVVVGRIDEIWRDGEFVRARGVFDMKDPFAADIARKVDEGFLKGVSVDVDDYHSDMEYVWPEEVVSEAGDAVGDDTIMSILFGEPEKVVYHKGRIRGAAVVAIPAFVEATIQLVHDEDVAASGEPAVQQYGPVGVHDAPTSDGAWDGAAQEARLPAQLQPTVAYGMYAWLSYRGDQALGTIGRQYCHLPHHEVDDEGRVGAANVTGVTVALRALDGLEIPDGRRRQVYQHLASHLRDAGLEAPPYAEPAVTAAVVTEAPPRPSAAWFEDPRLSVPTPITVDPHGRVYGHAAQWGQCHVGFADLCVTPPREDSHPYFMTGEIETAEGARVAVGQITLGTGHAATHLSASQAAEHYDHTGAAVADVVVGNDAHGIWVAGAVRPEAEEYRVRQLRAAGQVSGDWRRIGGQLRLVGLLAVNVPGFPVPRLQARVASGVPVAVVAAGRLQVAPGGLDEHHLETVALEFIRNQLAARVARSAPTPPPATPVAAPTTPDVDRLRAELAARVAGTTEGGGD